jgi:hypothetical protein
MVQESEKKFYPAAPEEESLREREFRDAMQKRQYSRAASIMVSILLEDKNAAGENYGDINRTHLDMARRLALKYFDHQTSLLESRYQREDLLDHGVYDYTSLAVVYRVYQIFDFKINIIPEAQEPDSKIHKALRLAYQEDIRKGDDFSAYGFGKIGGFLNKEEYRKLFDIALDKNSVERAHLYAVEGGLYDATNPEIKSLLDELESIKEKIRRLRERRVEENLHLLEFNEKYGDEFRALDKRRKDILELLVLSVE